MPIIGDAPEPLRVSLEAMEATIQSFKKNIGYVAPEAQDAHWGQLQMDLASTLTELYEEMEKN